ncbi:acyltransferase [Mesorhizobium sp. M1006]|uniref:acyltransferase family protein n=1 Tax=Mesorhizobium sp. M1006 TaxID=2957048 RepID=UPI00333CEA65
MLQKHLPRPGSPELLYKRGEYSFGLDVVRAAAISLVLLSHLWRPVEFLGVAGVELFFALSGFLIGGIFIRGSEKGFGAGDLIAFWRRRWARTLPNYFLFLFVFWALLPPRDTDESTYFFSYMTFTQNLFWPISDFFSVSWSLAIEEWFYVIFPVVALFFIAAFRGPRPAILATILILIAGSFLTRVLNPTPHPNLQMRMVVGFRLDALALGVLGAWLVHWHSALVRMLSHRVIVCAAILLLPTLGLSLLHFGSSMPPVLVALLFTAIPLSALLIVLASLDCPAIGGVAGASIKGLSRWSYSLYLSHIPVLFSLYRLPGYSDFTDATKILVRFLGISLALLISFLLFTYFEQPALNALSRSRAKT